MPLQAGCTPVVLAAHSSYPCSQSIYFVLGVEGGCSQKLFVSACCGFSFQVTKQPGDGVIGGTVNGSGLLYIRATCVGGQTVLAQIISLVEAAQAYKAPIQVGVRESLAPLRPEL